MEVISIIKLVATYLQLDDLLNDVLLGGSNETSEENQKEINLLVSCVNLCNNIVATDYIPLTRTSVINNSNGIIPIDSVDNGNKTIYEILNVKNKFDESQVFKIVGNDIKTVKGFIQINYSYFPDSVELDSIISCYLTKLTDRIFAYGVACEYCFIKGMYDDASMWDARFKDSMKTICRPKKNITIPARSWN